MDSRTLYSGERGEVRVDRSASWNVTDGTREDRAIWGIRHIMVLGELRAGDFVRVMLAKP
jgi:hypothetical protein